MYRLALLILCAIDAAQASHLVMIDPNCIGSIIHRRWILTAASCPVTLMTPIIVDGTIYGIQTIARHPGFVKNYPNNDIALIRLSSDLMLGGTTKSIVVNLNEYNDYRKLTLLVGSAAQFTIVDESVCYVYTSEYWKMICTVSTYSPQQPCPLPTGTPITYANQLVGLEVGTNGCGAQAHMFTRVSRFASWLLNQLAVYGDQISYS